MWLGRVLWKRGDGWLIDGFGPDGVSARVLDVTRNVVRLQTGYLYHYAFAMLIGVAALITWFMFRAGPSDGELAHPLGHDLPAAGGRAVHHDAARRRQSRQAQRPLDRALDDADHLRGFARAVWRFDPSPEFQFVEKQPWLAGRSPITWASTAFRCRSSS